MPTRRYALRRGRRSFRASQAIALERGHLPSAPNASRVTDRARASAKPQLGLAGGLTLLEGFEAHRPPAERTGQVLSAFGLGGEGCLLKQLHKLGDGAAGGLGLHPTLQFLHSKPLNACRAVTIRDPWGRGWPRRVCPVAPASVASRSVGDG